MQLNYKNKIRLLVIVSGLLLISKTNGQKCETDLYGFQIGQYRETASNEFGKSYKHDKFEDGYVYEAFIIKPDTSLYIVFEYAAEDTGIIWSIQITGTNTATDLGFHNLKLGVPEAHIISLFGKPTEIVDIGEYGKRLDYDSSNYSFEINPKGVLSSIKIKNTWSSKDLKLGSDTPSFKKIVKAFTSSSNKEISAMVAPDLEIYEGKKAIFFKRNMGSEIENDKSGVFRLIKKISRNLENINTKDTTVYDENLRLYENGGSSYVIKIYKGSAIKEIVLRYINGRYKVWEIKT